MTEAMKLDKEPNEIKRSKTFKDSELKKESESFTL